MANADIGLIRQLVSSLETGPDLRIVVDEDSACILNQS